MSNIYQPIAMLPCGKISCFKYLVLIISFVVFCFQYFSDFRTLMIIHIFLDILKRYNKVILSYLISSYTNLCNLIFSVYHSSSAMYPGCQRLFMRSFRFRSSLKKSPAVFLAASPLLSSAFGRRRSSSHARKNL